MTASFAIDSLTKRGDKSWRLSYHSVSADGTRGKRLYTTLVNCSGKREARAKAQEFLAQKATKVPSSGGPTIATLLNEEASRLLSTRAIEDSTHRGYAEGIKRLDWLGDIKAGDLAEEDVVRRITEMIELGYSPSTINDTLQLCRRAVRLAMTKSLIQKDVTLGIRGPKRQQTKPRSLTREELRRLVALLGQTSGYLPTAIRLALSTGMRVGEICALQWKSVDLRHGWLKVEQAIGRGSKGRTYLKAPKTASSARKLPIEPGLATALEARRSEQRLRCKNVGRAFSENLFVIGDIDGTFLDPHAVSREFAGLVTAAAIADGKCRFHWLRHTFATTMISSGVDVRTVSAWLGHSDPSTTLRLYVDLDETAMAESVNILEKALAPDRANSSLERTLGNKQNGCRIVSFGEISSLSRQELSESATCGVGQDEGVS